MAKPLLAMIATVALGLGFVSCGDDDEEVVTMTATESEATEDSADGDPTLTDTAATTEISSENFQTPVTVVVGPDWTPALDTETEYILEHPRGASGPQGFVNFLYIDTVYNPADTQQQQPAPSDMLQWLQEHPGLITTGEQPVTIDGINGTRVELRGDNTGDLNLFEISDGTYELNYNERSYLYVLDVGGKQLLIHAVPEFTASFDEFEEIAEPVVFSAQLQERN